MTIEIAGKDTIHSFKGNKMFTPAAFDAMEIVSAALACFGFVLLGFDLLTYCLKTDTMKG